MHWFILIEYTIAEQVEDFFHHMDSLYEEMLCQQALRGKVVQCIWIYCVCHYLHFTLAQTHGLMLN